MIHLGRLYNLSNEDLIDELAAFHSNQKKPSVTYDTLQTFETKVADLLHRKPTEELFATSGSGRQEKERHDRSVPGSILLVSQRAPITAKSCIAANEVCLRSSRSVQSLRSTLVTTMLCSATAWAAGTNPKGPTPPLMKTFLSL